jgi:uncharacterized repeat protein (TIGR03803 family)
MNCLLTSSIHSQTLTVLHTFSDLNNGTNADGVDGSGLLLLGETLYGTTSHGGNSGHGVIFSLRTDGTGFKTLYNFSPTSQGIPSIPNSGTNSDGAEPGNGLSLSGDFLSGTTLHGGTLGGGAVFTLRTNGSVFNNLIDFRPGPLSGGPNLDSSSVILADQKLYGTVYDDGGFGTVFAVNTDGTGFTILHSFNGFDGAGPGQLLVVGDTLYGTTAYGGPDWAGFIFDNPTSGTVFSLKTNGTGFTLLYIFSDLHLDPVSFQNLNSDGAYPSPHLAYCGKTLYGTAIAGGIYGAGTIFAIQNP